MAVFCEECRRMRRDFLRAIDRLKTTPVSHTGYCFLVWAEEFINMLFDLVVMYTLQLMHKQAASCKGCSSSFSDSVERMVNAGSDSGRLGSDLEIPVSNKFPDDWLCCCSDQPLGSKGTDNFINNNLKLFSIFVRVHSVLT